LHKKEMVVSDIESIAEGFGEGLKPLLESMFSLGSANTLLVSALVKHLVDEGVINLDKYLESNKHYEELLKNIPMQESDEDELLQRNTMMLEKIFTEHRNDLAKPE